LQNKGVVPQLGHLLEE